jgi:cystathionine beta-lyase/cystathionine gamma-synthase
VKDLSRATQIVHQGSAIHERASNPESLPIYLTTAFHPQDLDDLEDIYREKGYAYIRSRNPNRNALAELVNCLEKGERSIICNCGMAAISTLILSLVHSGDHILADQTLYGESIDLLEKLDGFGIATTFVDMSDLTAVEQSIQGNTKILYTETISNPMIAVADIDSLADIAHQHGAKLVVDNTFATSLLIAPIDHGADVTINSLTKFANGHSDASAGSITSTNEIIEQAYRLQVLLGTTADPFDAWIVQRGMRTMDLRVRVQMDNATKVAAALQSHPAVSKVYHPSLPEHPQHELATKEFTNGYGAMLSFEIPEDRDKINAFLRHLNIVHYAMTLGGYRTTLQHPMTSSHYGFPQEELDKIGITFGLIRLSVGMENSDDIIHDLFDALSVFDE